VIGKSKEEILAMGPEIITDIIGEELALSRPKCSTLGISTVKLAIKELEKEETKKQALS
jgi:NifU-like protein involved in Fe-S cluster formation